MNAKNVVQNCCSYFIYWCITEESSCVAISSPVESSQSQDGWESQEPQHGGFRQEFSLFWDKPMWIFWLFHGAPRESSFLRLLQQSNSPKDFLDVSSTDPKWTWLWAPCFCACEAVGLTAPSPCLSGSWAALQTSRYLICVIKALCCLHGVVW